MLTTTRTILALGLWCAVGSTSLVAQARNEFGTWVGVSTGTPTLIGTTESTSLSIVAMRYSRIVLQRSAFDLLYTMDLIPIVRLSYRDELDELLIVRGKGAVPLGIEVRFRPGRRVEPTVAISGGFAYFDGNVPREGRKFNFSADSGVGLQFNLGPSIGFQIGYRYHHLSNGYRSSVNPGFDSHLVTFGASIAL